MKHGTHLIWVAGDGAKQASWVSIFEAYANNLQGSAPFVAMAANP
jgi:hypothetical protein